MLDLLKNETFIITVLGIVCLMIIIINRLSSKKEKELDDKVQNNVTSIGEISPEDIPNTELTEKELREIDINPLTLRDFIFRFSECIANDCMDYMKEEDDYWPEHLRIEAKKQIRSNIIAETAVALFILTYEIFRNDMISSEWNTVYSYISGFWNHSYNDRIIDGPWKYGTYKDLIKIRLTAYSRILGYHSVRIDLGSFLSAYIDYHCQTILSLPLTQEATPYTPSQVESGGFFFLSH